MSINKWRLNFYILLFFCIFAVGKCYGSHRSALLCYLILSINPYLSIINFYILS